MSVSPLLQSPYYPQHIANDILIETILQTQLYTSPSMKAQAHTHTYTRVFH